MLASVSTWHRATVVNEQALAQQHATTEAANSLLSIYRLAGLTIVRQHVIYTHANLTVACILCTPHGRRIVRSRPQENGMVVEKIAF